jgi:chromosome segregation ATPase
MTLDPNTKLEELKGDLNTTEKEIAERNKQKETLKKDISDLQKKVDEVNQILKAYGQDVQNIEDQKKEFENYSKNNTTIIEQALGDKKAEIDTKIADFDKETKKKEGEITALEIKYNTSEAKFQTANDALKEKEKEYDSLKNLKNEITNKLKELRGLKDSIDKINTKAKKYFLISELNALLNETKPIVKMKDELESELYVKLEELGSKRDELRTAEEARNAALEEYKTRKDELEKLNRRDEILKIIS